MKKEQRSGGRQSLYGAVAVVLMFWLVGMSIAVPAYAGIPESFNPSEYLSPTCPSFFEFKAFEAAEAKDGGTCHVKDLSGLTEADCKAAGFIFQDGACVQGENKPDPQCKPIPGFESTITGRAAEVKCSYERKIIASAPGDYIGDCFHVKVVPPGTSLKSDTFYLVTGQSNLETGQELTVVRGELQGLGAKWFGDYPLFIIGLGCKPAVDGEQHKVAPAKLIEAGASRRGYAYGFLTMPYKYFPSEKSFLVNVPIGGYFGWRWGQAGSGVTTAIAVTLSSVKANTVDPNTLDAEGKPAVTGTADVAALSGAFGFVFDVLKSPTQKSVKAGFFVGKDYVNDDPTIDYRFNRKTWIAIQLGFDFTDN